MDVKVLLSLYEGLPNVLIEAQSLGVPVVSTPAGGASECFLNGETGELLSCEVSPSIDEACDCVETILQKFEQEPERAHTAKAFVEANFSDSNAKKVFIEMLKSSTDSPAMGEVACS